MNSDGLVEQALFPEMVLVAFHSGWKGKRARDTPVAGRERGRPRP